MSRKYSQARACVAVLTIMAAVVFGFAPAASASSVTGVTAPTLTTTAAGATGVEYKSIGFTVSPTGALSPSDGSITLIGPAGMAWGTGCEVLVHNDTTGQDVASCTGFTSNGGATLTVNLNEGQPVNAGDHLTVTVHRVTNPPAGTYTLAVRTSADVDPAASAPYTVTAQQNVSGVTAPTISTTAAGATGVEYHDIGFTVSSTGQLSPDGGRIVLTGPAGTVWGTGCDVIVHNDTTGQDVATCSGFTSNGGATLTINLNEDVPVNAGDHLTIDVYRVTNPPAGTHTVSVSTSSDLTPVASGPYTVTAQQNVSGVTAPTISTTAAGATGVEYHDIGFTVSSTGQLSPDGGRIVLTGPAGTVWGTGCDVIVHNDTTGQDVATCSGFTSNGGATLTINLNEDVPVNAGDHLTIDVYRVTNPPAGTHTVSVSTSSDLTPVASGPYTVTAQQNVSGVTAPTISTTAAGATGVEYHDIGFTVSSTGQLSPDGGRIVLTGPVGTVWGTGCDVIVHNDTTGQDVATCSGFTSNGGATLTINLNEDVPVNAGDHLTIDVYRVTNPPAGTHTVSVSTSSDLTPVASGPYTVTAQQNVSSVTTAASSLTPGATGVEYRVGFTTSSTGQLSPDGGRIVLTGPAGTVWGTGCDVSVHNDTTGQDVATCSGFTSNGGATLTIDLNEDVPVNAGDRLTIRIQDVTNPSSGTLSTSTSSDRGQVASAPYTSPIPPVPVVSAISPASGPAAGGTSITVTGTGFTGATGVQFGPNPAVSFSVVSNTQLTATSPAGAGTVDVVVNTLGGKSATSAANRFTYSDTPVPTVTGISPTSGPAAGATSVTVTGTGFIGATAVSFGPNPATSFTVDSGTQISAISPAGSGTVDVRVTTPAGTSADTTADNFIYIPPVTTSTTTSTTTTTTVPPTTTTTTVPPTTTSSTTSTSTVPATTTTTSAPTTTTAPPTTVAPTTTTAPPTTTTSPSTTAPPTTVAPTTTTSPPTTTTAPPTTTTAPPTTTTAPPRTLAPTTTVPPLTSAPPTTAPTRGTVPAMSDMETPIATTAPGTSGGFTSATTSLTSPSTSTSTTTTTSAPAPAAPGGPLVAAQAPPPSFPASDSTAGGLRAVSIDGTTHGPPGVGLRVAGTGYPADCNAVYIFFDGTRVGTARPDSAGNVAGERLRVPGEARPGPHRVTSSCNVSGNPVVQATSFQVMDSDAHRVALVSALPRPGDVDFSIAALLASAAVVAGMLFLIAFPGELFNSTLESHYDEVRGWFGLKPKRPEDRSGRSQFLPFAAFLLAGGVLVSLLNPSFAFDRSGLGAALGLTIAIGVITLAYDIPSLAWVRRNHRDWGRLVILPGTIVIGIACVILSRAVHFLPGYFYGLIAGLAFRRQIADSVKGKLTALSVVVVLGLSLASWLAMAPVSAAADQPGASLGLFILEAMLGGIFWCGLDSLVIGMLPLRFLGGSEVRAWSRLGWVALFAVTQLAFVHIMLRPSTGYVADTTQSPTTIVIVLFVVFALFSIAFWAYFRFRTPRDAASDRPNLVEVA